MSVFDESTCLSYALYALLFIGALKVATVSLSFASMVFDLYLLPAVNWKQWGAGKEDANWAVVTGASDGIGREFARQIAQKGYNVVLVSRTQSKLEAVAAEIEFEFKVKTHIVAFDASTDEPANYALLADGISDKKVTVLVNNVGRSHSIPVSFMDTTDEEMHDIMTINNNVTLKVTRTVVPQMLETLKRQKDIKGLILTMGSFAGLFPTPMLATYSGSKFFLQGWSAALAGELKSKDIDVELALSYLVTSKMSKVRRASFSVPDPKHFVASTVRNVGRRVGAQERYATITPYQAHALMHWFVAETVGVFSKLANNLNLVMHKDIRSRALKKLARKAAEKEAAEKVA